MDYTGNSLGKILYLGGMSDHSDRFVTASVTIKARTDKVIKAFVDPAMLYEWWQVERCFIDLSTGGCYTLTWGISERGFQYVSTGRIKTFDPSKHLHLTDMLYLNPEKPILGPMELEVEAVERPDGSQVNVTQRGYGQGADWDWYYQAVKAAWPEVLQSLKMFLEA